MKKHVKIIAFGAILGVFFLCERNVNNVKEGVAYSDVVLANVEAIAGDEAEGGGTASVICSNHPTRPIFCTGETECVGSVEGGYVRCDGWTTYC